MRGVRRALALVGATLAMSVLLVSCGSEEPTIPTVAVEAADFSFAMPDTIAGGLTSLAFTNTGQDAHHMQIFKLNPGVSRQQFDDTLQQVLRAIPEQGEAAFSGLFQLGTFAGEPAPIGPGGTLHAFVNLEQGEYTLICFVAGADGVPHIAKGMVKPLTVGPSADEQPAEPEADAEVALNDFAFTGVPTTLASGNTTFKVTNQGQEPHEMIIFRLKGVSMAQVREVLMAPPGEAPPGPPPIEESGGFQAIMPGTSGWATVNLAPGEYGLVCFLPSQANDFAPHFALGMISSITVQ